MEVNSMHPSRVNALKASHSLSEGDSVEQRSTKPLGKMTKADKMALEEQKRLETEKQRKEREQKIKLREKRRIALRKMTSKGQPVMKTRLEDLLGKVKKVMRDA
jgi:hypothetical protein